MIYIATVHWREPQWIAPQLEYLHRYIDEPFQVYAALNGIDDRSLWKGFDYAEDMKGPHGVKLNALAEIVTEQAKPEDIIVFLDSDAFPIAQLDRWLESTLPQHPLVAVQRRENFGDLRPHPSFCATTVGLWSELGGDWSREPWTTPTGTVLDDAGTAVLRSLEEHDIDWLPLVRTNTHDTHPLWFGVYGHHIYHHGAGSRLKWSVLDDQKVFTDAALMDPSLGSLATTLRQDPRALLRVRPRHLKVLPPATARSVRQIRKRLMLRSTERQSDRILSRLMVDPLFYREFEAPGSTG
jgi:hypothetical protein